MLKIHKNLQCWATIKLYGQGNNFIDTKFKDKKKFKETTQFLKIEVCLIIFLYQKCFNRPSIINL